MLFTFIILGVTILLFIWGRFPVELVALVSLLALILLGILDVGQALAGFGDSTVVMIAALFVVGEGLSRTGVTGWLGERLLRWAGGNETRLLVLMMLGAAGLSAFISNTGTVATLLPAVVAASWRIGSNPSRFLIPLSFAASTGGLLTLTGSPPNIIVADALAEGGYEPFGYFEFGWIGLPLLLLATVFMVWFGKRLLPTRGSQRRPIDVEASIGELTEAYSIDREVYRLRVRRGSGLTGKTLREAGLGSDFGLLVVHVERADDRREMHLPAPLAILTQERELFALGPDTQLFEGDVLDAIGTEEAVQKAMTHFRLSVVPVDEVGDAGRLPDPAGGVPGRELGERDPHRGDDPDEYGSSGYGWSGVVGGRTGRFAWANPSADADGGSGERFHGLPDAHWNDYEPACALTWRLPFRRLLEDGPALAPPVPGGQLGIDSRGLAPLT